MQSKPVNDVVYGQVVFDKQALAEKILKEEQIKVRLPILDQNLENIPSIGQWTIGQIYQIQNKQLKYGWVGFWIYSWVVGPGIKNQ